MKVRVLRVFTVTEEHVVEVADLAAAPAAVAAGYGSEDRSHRIESAPVYKVLWQENEKGEIIR